MILAAVPTPAQLMTPPRGASVVDDQSTVSFTAQVTCESSVMSVLKNLTFGEESMASGAGERSTIDT